MRPGPGADTRDRCRGCLQRLRGSGGAGGRGGAAARGQQLSPGVRAAGWGARWVDRPAGQIHSLMDLK